MMQVVVDWLLKLLGLAVVVFVLSAAAKLGWSLV
jgi:hypothetical protein